jgi:hypothetical protein
VTNFAGTGALSAPRSYHNARFALGATALAPLSFISTYDPPVLASGPWLRKLRVLGHMPYRLVFNLVSSA